MRGWFVDRFGSKLVKDVTVEDANGSLEIIVHMHKHRCSGGRWKEIAATAEQQELKSLIGGVHFELFGVSDG